jgi:hypothetical protein
VIAHARDGSPDDASRDDATRDAERWRAIAATTPATALRQRALRLLLLLVGLPGLGWLVIIGWWALRRAWPVFWVVIAAHLLAVVVAWGLPVRARAADATGDHALALRTGHAARARRLAVLCGALLVELLGNVLWSAGWAMLVEPPFRLGPGFTTAAATLWFAWPLWRIAAAQRDEARRLEQEPLA